MEGGTYRVNRTKVELSKAARIGVDFTGNSASFAPEALRSVPLFSSLADDIIARMAARFKTEEVSLGNKLIVEGEDRSKFFFGTPVITWRGVPLIPCDKLEMKSKYESNQWFGTTSILLLRIGEKDQGVVGLHQAGIPGEIMPSLSARLMGMDTLGVANYLLTLYFSCAVLTDDALGVLQNVEVGYYHNYDSRKPKVK